MFQYVFAGVNRRICLRTNKASFVFVVERVFSKSNRTIAVSGLFHGTSLGLSPKNSPYWPIRKLCEKSSMGRENIFYRIRI